MGCDIHCYAERYEGGRWVPAQALVKNKYYNAAFPDDGDEWEIPQFYHDRNYDLFGILANVRNGRGFAGIKTGEGFAPMADPRGLPEDVSLEIQAISDKWDSDGHSHSYFTVAELIAYDWTQITINTGVLGAADFVEWSRWRRRNGEPPDSYSGAVSGRSITMLAAADMERRIDELPNEKWHPQHLPALLEQAGLVHAFAQFAWEIPYYRAAGTWWSDAMPRLFHLGSPEQVRIVFWFDN